MTAIGIMDVYPFLSFYITIENVDKVNVDFPKHRTFVDVKNAPEAIVHIKDKCFSYSSGSSATKCDSFFRSIHYKPTSDCLVQLRDHKAVKGKHADSLRKV